MTGKTLYVWTRLHALVIHIYEECTKSPFWVLMARITELKADK